MATKSVSTQQSGQVCDASHYLTVNANGPVVIFDIEGEVTSTTGNAYYIQLLGTATPSSGSTVPLYSREVVAAAAASGVNGFSFVYRPQGLDTSTMANPVGGTVATSGRNNLPVYVAISSTDNVYTSVAASTQVTVNYELVILENTNETVGTLSSGVDSYIVYADPNAAKRLVRFTASNSGATSGAPLYLMLFGYASPATGATPITQWKFTSSTAATMTFNPGLAVMQGNPSTYAISTGCYLYGSSTATVYTATATAAWTIQAWNI